MAPYSKALWCDPEYMLKCEANLSIGFLVQAPGTMVVVDRHCIHAVIGITTTECTAINWAAHDVPSVDWMLRALNMAASHHDAVEDKECQCVIASGDDQSESFMGYIIEQTLAKDMKLIPILSRELERLQSAAQTVSFIERVEFYDRHAAAYSLSVRQALWNAGWRPQSTPNIVLELDNVAIGEEFCASFDAKVQDLYVLSGSESVYVRVSASRRSTTTSTPHGSSWWRVTEKRPVPIWLNLHDCDETQLAQAVPV